MGWSRVPLLSQQQALLVIRQNLLLQHSLLTAWCEALTLLQEKQGQLQQPAAADYDPDVQEQFQQLLHCEIILLGESTCSQQPPSCSVVSIDPGPDALSPGGSNSSN